METENIVLRKIDKKKWYLNNGRNGCMPLYIIDWRKKKKVNYILEQNIYIFIIQ